MTPEEEKMLSLQLQSIMDTIEAQAEQQALKDKNLLLHLESISKEIKMQKEIFTLITDNDRKISLQTLANTEKTNGRVNDLERTKNDHYLNCPRIQEINDVYDKIEKVENSVEDLTFIQRHPVLFLGLVTVSSILAILAIIKS